MKPAPRGVPESTSRSMMSSRHSPSGGRAPSGSRPVIARIRRGRGGAVRPHHPHQSLGLAEGCQPGLSDLGSSVPSQQPSLTHGSRAPFDVAFAVSVPAPKSEGRMGGSSRPGSRRSSSKSKGEAVGSRRRRVGGGLVSRGKSREGGYRNIPIGVAVCLRWGDVVAWRARWTLGQREGRKFVKEKRGGG